MHALISKGIQKLGVASRSKDTKVEGVPESPEHSERWGHTRS